ncbi:hypothetical protein BST13_12030 [Mycobacterium aquaticum]|uniref:Uncharacterized protein n=2 Tax=Mycobacterium aquaticum TaxID=1927124 RepID=A0A1X0B1S0_9MYCO|nr:hypothetical protein BST13_12030 [Mycobacterium aquaticum]
MGLPGGPPPKKSRAFTVFLAIAGALGLLLVAGFVVSAVNSEPKRGPAGDDQRAANAKTAKYESDFETVCGNGSVSNAAAYAKPYKIIAFSQGDRPDSWDSVTLTAPVGYRSSADSLSSINAVACLSRKAGTEVKSMTCEFDSGGDTVKADYYAVEYDIDLYEAKTGKSITSLGSVKGPATSCPFLATFSKSSPKVYASPDDAAVDAKLAEFAAK